MIEGGELPVYLIGGLNLQLPAHRIGEMELQNCKNGYAKLPGILAKRKGSSKYNATEISSALRIAGLYRFYHSYPTGRLICAANFTNPTEDRLYSGSDVTGAMSEITGATTLSNGKRYWFAQYGGNCYICNGADIPQVTADGLTRADITPPGGAPYLASMPTFQGCIPYREQMVWWGHPDTDKRSRIYWGDYYLPHKIGALQYLDFVDERNDEVTVCQPYAVGTSSQGVYSQLVVFKNDSHYVVNGILGSLSSPWGTISQTTSYSIMSASTKVGCPARQTVALTPLGLIFMGTDNVYLFNPQGEPTKIGNKLGSIIADIPPSAKKLASACFHDGFYKLSLTVPGGSYNTIQYWMDCRTGEGFVPGAWYGPMTGLNLSHMVAGRGETDDTLIWGAGAANGFLYLLNQNLYTDVGVPIAMAIQTKNFDARQRNKFKRLPQIDYGVFISSGTSLSLNFYADHKFVFGTTIPYSATGALWDVALWDVDLWIGDTYEEHGYPLASRVVGREISAEFLHSDPTEFQLSDFTLDLQLIDRRLTA